MQLHGGAWRAAGRRMQWARHAAYRHAGDLYLAYPQPTHLPGIAVDPRRPCSSPNTP